MGLYTAFWFYFSNQLKNNLTHLIEHNNQLTNAKIKYDKLAIIGFPTRLGLKITNLTINDDNLNLRISVLDDMIILPNLKGTNYNIKLNGYNFNLGTSTIQHKSQAKFNIKLNNPTLGFNQKLKINNLLHSIIYKEAKSITKINENIKHENDFYNFIVLSRSKPFYEDNIDVIINNKFTSIFNNDNKLDQYTYIKFGLQSKFNKQELENKQNNLDEQNLLNKLEYIQLNIDQVKVRINDSYINIDGKLEINFSKDIPEVNIQVVLKNYNEFLDYINYIIGEVDNESKSNLNVEKINKILKNIANIEENSDIKDIKFDIIMNKSNFKIGYLSLNEILKLL